MVLPDDKRYADPTLENLITRYEEPSSAVRWDSPLFILPWDEPLPADAILEAITSGIKKPPTHGVVQHAKPPTDALQTLDQTSSAILNIIMQAQTSGTATGGGSVPITLPSSLLKDEIILPQRHLTLSELQRHKRQFIAVHKKALSSGMAGQAELDWAEDRIARKFIVHLRENLKP